MSSVEERLDRIEKQLYELRGSIAYLRGVVEQLGKRLNHIESELKELRSWTGWIVGILITMWVTIIAAVLLK